MSFLSSGKKASYFLTKYAIPTLGTKLETKEGNFILNEGVIIDDKYFIISGNGKIPFSQIKKPKICTPNYELEFAKCWNDFISGNEVKDPLVERIQILSSYRILKSHMNKKTSLEIIGNNRYDQNPEWIDLEWSENQYKPNNTSKADFQLGDCFISYKHDENCQIMSAEPNELYRIYFYASKTFRPDERADILDNIIKLNKILSMMKLKSTHENKILKKQGQKIMDRIHSRYKKLSYSVYEETISGNNKFISKGKATHIIIGNKFFTIKQFLKSEKLRTPRVALPKGILRPGNVKL